VGSDKRATGVGARYWRLDGQHRWEVTREQQELVVGTGKR